MGRGTVNGPEVMEILGLDGSLLTCLLRHSTIVLQDAMGRGAIKVQRIYTLSHMNLLLFQILKF